MIEPVSCNLTVPAGTPIAAPVSKVVPQMGGWVSRARLRIPDGPNGLCGWQLVLAGTVIIPYAGDGWVIGNDEEFPWIINRYCNDGQLAVNGYNLGGFPHTFYFLLDWEPAEPGAPVAVSIESGLVSPGTTAADVAAIMSPVPDLAAATADQAAAAAPLLDASGVPLDASVPSADVSGFPPPPDVIAPGDLTAYAPVNRARLFPGTHLTSKPPPPRVTSPLPARPPEHRPPPPHKPPEHRPPPPHKPTPRGRPKGAK